MSEAEKASILERVAALPQEDQRNLAFFVAGMAAKTAKTEPASDKPEQTEEKKEG